MLFERFARVAEANDGCCCTTTIALTRAESRDVTHFTAVRTKGVPLMKADDTLNSRALESPEAERHAHGFTVRIPSRFHVSRLRLGPRSFGMPSYVLEWIAMNRACEPILGSPGTIVSARLAGFFAERKLLGMRFRPVLVAGTALQREHAERWARIARRLRL